MLLQLILAFSLISFSSTDRCVFPDDRYIDGGCFILVSKRLNYYDAQQYCQRNVRSWSNLAVEFTRLQSNFLTSFARTEFNGDSGNFWIGVYRPSVYENFRTILGGRLQFDNFKYPNPSMNYAAVRLSDGTWDTKPEEQLLPFVCSYPAIQDQVSVVSYKGAWLEQVARQRILKKSE